jgi:hypothetical protein
MTTKYLMPVLMFVLKYFFDIEREITYHMVTAATVRIHDCKEIISNLVMLHR